MFVVRSSRPSLSGQLAFADDAKQYAGFRSFKNLFTTKGNRVEHNALIPSNKLGLDMEAFVQSWRLDRDDDGNECARRAFFITDARAESSSRTRRTTRSISTTPRSAPSRTRS